MKAVVAAASLAVLLIFAGPVAMASEAFYVEPAELPPQLLASPPEEGSLVWKKQIETICREQHKLSHADIVSFRNEQHLRLNLMTDAVGSDFTEDHYPKTFALLKQVLADASAITEADKRFWHTRRPYLTHSCVKLMVDPLDASPAYPSGHTSEMRVIGEVLGMLYPDRIDEFRARANEIGFHRIEAGVHYPNDIEGGKMLAMLIVGALSAHSEFQTDLSEAREEITTPH